MSPWADAGQAVPWHSPLSELLLPMARMPKTVPTTSPAPPTPRLISAGRQLGGGARGKGWRGHDGRRLAHQVERDVDVVTPRDIDDLRGRVVPWLRRPEDVPAYADRLRRSEGRDTERDVVDRDLRARRVRDEGDV